MSLYFRSPDGEGDNVNLPNAKVVSIVGNTGEGKSYALNRTFFARDDDNQDSNSFQEVNNVDYRNNVLMR